MAAAVASWKWSLTLACGDEADQTVTRGIAKRLQSWKLLIQNGVFHIASANLENLIVQP